MSFPNEIKRIRQRSFLTQEDFAGKMNVAFSTVNRWEGGKSKPNMTAMKKIKEFCLKNDIEYFSIEEAWLDYKTETKIMDKRKIEQIRQQYEKVNHNAEQAGKLPEIHNDEEIED